MLVLLALALLPQEAQEPEETDIIVIGRRLSAMQVVIGRNERGKSTCGLTASSGSKRLDESLCRTAAKCERKGARDNAEVQACVEARKPELLAAVRRALDGSR